MSLTPNQKYLFKNSFFWAVYEGFNATFLIAFALALGASNTVVGILGALPFVSMMFSQILGAKILEFYKRKPVYFVSTIISRVSWILIILIPYFFKTRPLVFVVIFFFFIRFIEYVSDPAWVSIVADIVPESKRGVIFGLRRKWMAFAVMISSLIGGIYLDIFPKDSFTGFTTMFFFGILFGLMATLFFGKIKAKPYLDKKHHGLKEFFTLKKDLKKFCLLMIFFNFAVMIATPLFIVYLLKGLGLSYTLFISVGVVATTVRILSYKHFGKISDKYGDKPITVLGVLGTSLVPLFYIFITAETLWLLIPAQIISGLSWAAVHDGMFNLLLDFTDRKTRALQVAKYTTLASIPMIFAPILGGVIADNFTFILTGIPLVFAISFVLRFVSGILFLSIKEPRAKKDYSIYYVLKKAIGIHPIQEIEHTIHYFTKIIR